MNWSAALPTFVITLREGFEAALVVGIVLACLQKAQKSQFNPWVYGGIGAGIAASACVGVLLNWGLQALNSSDRPYAPALEALFKGGLCVVAIAMLSWMLIWMTQQARSLKAEVEGAVSSVLQQTGAEWGIFSLIFIAVLREGFETVIFIVARFQQGLTPALGALLGLVSAAFLGTLLFKWGVKINVRSFFQIMGIFLLLVVSGLVVSALKNIEVAVSLLAQLQLSFLSDQLAALCSIDRASCILGTQVWDLSHILPDREFPGIVLKALLGYRDKLYLVQAIGYIIFLATAGSLYFRSLTGSASEPRNSSNSA